jgi:hypothetical protein
LHSCRLSWALMQIYFRKRFGSCMIGWKMHNPPWKQSNQQQSQKQNPEFCFSETERRISGFCTTPGSHCLSVLEERKKGCWSPVAFSCTQKMENILSLPGVAASVSGEGGLRCLVFHADSCCSGAGGDSSEYR